MQMSAKALQAQLDKVKALEGRLTFRIAVLSKQLDQQVNALLKDTPLGVTSYRILTVIDTFGAISISDISRFNAIDRAQVSRTARELERLGLVTFRAAPNSKRKKLAAPTEAGSALIADLAPRFDDRQRRLDAGLGDEALADLWRGIDRLAEIVQP